MAKIVRKRKAEPRWRMTLTVIHNGTAYAETTTYSGAAEDVPGDFMDKLEERIPNFEGDNDDGVERLTIDVERIVV